MSVVVAIILTYIVVMFFKSGGNSEFDITEKDGVYRVVRSPWYAPFLPEALPGEYKTFEDAERAAKQHRQKYRTW